MQAFSDCRVALIRTLGTAPQGMTLDSLLDQLAPTHAPGAVCDALAVAAGRSAVSLAFKSSSEEAQCLVFKPASVASEGGNADYGNAADALVKYLASRTDNRGDDDPIAHPVAILNALAPHYTPQEVEGALQLAFREELLVLVARASNSYVTVSLSRHRCFTVLAYDKASQQGRLFHVRAGRVEVAMRKLEGTMPHLQRLAVMSGKVLLQPADPHLPLMSQSL